MASAPLFFQFKRNNQIDSFLDFFKKNGWYIRRSISGTLTKYQWPDIVLSKMMIVGGFGIDRFGFYNFEGESEGQVILDYEAIMEAAQKYYDTCPSGYNERTLNDYFEDLSTVVIIHEFVHWLMHYAICTAIDPIENEKYSLAYGEGPNGYMYNEIDEIFFHEGLAQLFTFLFIKENENLANIFKWVNNQSPAQYTIFEKLYLNGLDNIELAVIYFNFYKTHNEFDQSFENLFVYLNRLDDEVLLHFLLANSTDLSNSKEFIQACFQKRLFYSFIYASENLKNDKDFIYSLLEIDSDYDNDNDEINWLKYISEPLKSDIDFILAAIVASNGNVSVMQWMNQDLLADDEFILNCVERTTFASGFLLFYAPNNLCNANFMLEAIARNPLELLDACDELKRNPEILNIVSEAIRVDQSWINIFVNDEIIKTELGLTAVEITETDEELKEKIDYFEKFKLINQILYHRHKDYIDRLLN